MTPTIELICGHRSIRHFTDEPISEAQREAIINSARATSSSSFLQCSSIIRITDKALREELVTLTGGQKHVAQAAEFWVFCADFNRHLQICPDAQLGLAEQLLLGVLLMLPAAVVVILQVAKRLAPQLMNRPPQYSRSEREKDNDANH